MITRFTSEAVCAGHPDKVCDQVADAILDAILAQDKDAHTAVEVMAAYDTLFLIGEVKTTANVDYEKIARETIKKIGYSKEEFGFEYDKIAVINKLHEQSADIDMGVSLKDDIGAGDQGIMFGYACRDTEEYLPLAYAYAVRMMKRLDEVKKDNLTYLGPDGKGQVTIEFEGGKATRIDTIVLSNQHLDEVPLKKIREDLKREVIDYVFPSEMIDDMTRILINPTGRFVIGGPVGDSGLTGRKIVADTYGGYAPHGGGAFSGKDPSKVDRSAAYYLRYVAKNLVASGLCDEATIQAGYAIGTPKPVSFTIDTHGTEKVSKEVVYKAVEETFDFSVRNIIETLYLKNIKYTELTNYSHFGKDGIPFERLDKVEELQKYLA